MRTAIIIPARYASSRFPGKPLAMLRGLDGVAKSLIERSWLAACAVSPAEDVWIATDDARIADAVIAFGGQVVMTAPSCRNGTERCAEAVSKLDQTYDIVVNLQGDAPLTPAFVVTKLVAALQADDTAVMATPALRCSPATLEHLLADAAAGRVGGTTVVFDNDQRALYFSKRVLPYTTHALPDAVHLHLGVYAYRPAALAAYAATPPCQMEELEGLEQLRFLAGGHVVRVVPFDPLEWECIELNNPEDIPVIEAVLSKRGMA